MAHDLFISYSTEDKPAADAVCAILEKNGVRCWIAPRDIMPGADWGESIVKGIRLSRVLLLVFSTNANKSKQIKREVEIAADGGVTIVPLRIENILPTEAFKYFLGNIHWLDALTPPLEKHLQEVAAKVKAILNTESVSPPEEADRPSAEILKVVYPLASKPAGPEREKPSPPSSGGTGGKSTSKQVIAFLAIAAVLVVGGLIYLSIRASQSPQPHPAPIAAVTSSPPVIATPTVEEKAPLTPEVAVQPSAQRIASTAVAIHSPPFTSIATSGLPREASIKNFIQTHLKSVETRQLNAYMSAYDDYVAWYGAGRVSANKIRQEMGSYLDSWDTITYNTTGPVQIHTLPNTRGVRVSYPIELNVSDQRTGSHRSRVGTETVELAIVNGALKIVSENQQLQ